jgi:hypothetical protein
MDREAAMIALVDVNNFYVARSAEVKALGIKMGPHGINYLILLSRKASLLAVAITPCMPI